MNNFYEDPIFTKGKIINTPEEADFNREIYHETGIDAKRVFISWFTKKTNIQPPYKNPYFVISIDILAMDNIVSEKYLKGRFVAPGDIFYYIDGKFINEESNDPETSLISKTIIDIFLNHFLHKFIKTPANIEAYRSLDKHYAVDIFSLYHNSIRMIFNHAYKAVKRVIFRAANERNLIQVGITTDENKVTNFIAYDSRELFERDTAPERREAYKKAAFAELKKFDYFDFLNYDEYEPVYKMKYELSYSERMFLIEEAI